MEKLLINILSFHSTFSVTKHTILSAFEKEISRSEPLAIVTGNLLGFVHDKFNS